MNEVVARISQVPQVSETTALVNMVERAARDPAVDIDKLERLLQMQERAMAQRAKSAYAAALAEMQPELPVVVERGKIDIGKGKPQSYALWEDINEAIKPVLARHGFALSFRTGQAEGKIIVTGVLSHRDGHSEETTMHLPVDGTGSKNAVQAVGSSTSYGKRYTASALLNLTSRGEDDDGKKGAGDPLSDEQAEKLKSMVAAVGANIQIFYKYLTKNFGYHVGRIEDIRAADFDRAVWALEAKKQKS